MMKYNKETINEIVHYNDQQLAYRADSYSGNEESESFFTAIRDAVVDATDSIDADDWKRQMVEDYSGSAHEIADNAPDVYTYPKWQEFVGTQAWQEDLDELGGDQGDMDANASVALYIIASRLVSALAEEIQASIEEDEE